LGGEFTGGDFDLCISNELSFLWIFPESWLEPLLPVCTCLFMLGDPEGEEVLLAIHRPLAIS